MARIVFYDVNEIDQDQLVRPFEGTEHEVISVSSGLTIDTVDTIADVISIFVSSPFPGDVMQKADGLKHIALRSTGFDHVDMDMAHQKNVGVSNVPTYGTHTVAEYAFSLLLTLTRKVPAAIKAAQKGVTPRLELQGFDLHGKTIGIIGAGRIGRATAMIARGFGMRVLAYDQFIDEKAAETVGYEYVSIDQLLAESDVVSLHAPYTNDNHHLMNGQLLAQMKRGALLINTARGELIDNRALIDALESGHLGGAAVDVLEGEHLINTSEELFLIRSEKADDKHILHSLELSVLKKMDNVIVTNHNAFNTREAIGRINQTTVDNIKAFLSGAPENIIS